MLYIFIYLFVTFYDVNLQKLKLNNVTVDNDVMTQLLLAI